MNDHWYEVKNVDEVASPSLLVYPERIQENIRRMIATVGDVKRLRTHMKTHKMPELIQMQLAAGITKFKCATIAEAEMVAECGAPDILFAYQPVGPNVKRFIQLVKSYPKTSFATITDDATVIQQLSKAFVEAGLTVPVLLDIDPGMQRCGVAAGPKAVELYRLLATLPGISPGGLHAYDGHIHDHDVDVRKGRSDAAFAPVAALKKELLAAGLSVPKIVAGGTPTFPIHAQRGEVECSPGTCVFWDQGYESKVPDLNFLVAALVLTRVVSKPGKNRLCLDLGHKAIAAENPHPRVVFLNLPPSTAVMHSEEHLVVECDQASSIPVGTAVYGVPWHICPTVALHAEAVVVENGLATKRWKTVARQRVLTI